MGAGAPSLAGRGTHSRVGVRARMGGGRDFLDTAPHMRGTVTPAPRGGRHLMERLKLSYVDVRLCVAPASDSSFMGSEQ